MKPPPPARDPDPKTGLCGGPRTCAALADCDAPDGSIPASSTWQLNIAIDVEVASADDVGASTVGHTYVEFKGTDGQLWTYGFYPNPAYGTPDPVFKPEVFGCVVHPDNIHTKCIDYRETFNVTEAQYRKALEFARSMCRATPRYNLKDFNCTTFAARIAEAAGQKLPNYRGKVGGTAGITADNPYALYDSIKDRDVPTWRLTDYEKIHDWLKNHSYAEVGRLPEYEKLRLINRVLKGWVHDIDIESVEWICKSVTDRAEMERIDKAIRPQADGLWNNKQKARLKAALDIRP